jgi:hypothetical protein
MAHFNELYKLVKVDRKCPQAAAMEKEFWNFLTLVVASEEVNQQEQPLDSWSMCNKALFNQRGSWMMSSEQCTSERV